jgi:rhamnogalacturonyl hydrolase YesR
MTDEQIDSMLALLLGTLAEHTKDKRFKAALKKVVPFFERSAKRRQKAALTHARSETRITE